MELSRSVSWNSGKPQLLEEPVHPPLSRGLCPAHYSCCCSIQTILKGGGDLCYHFGKTVLQIPLVFNLPILTEHVTAGRVCVWFRIPPPEVSPGNTVTGLIKLSSTSHGYVDSSICINDLWCNVTLPAGSDKH